MGDSEKELRKEIEYLLSLDDGYSDMVRDIQDDCMELNEVVPKVVRDIYVIGLFKGWENEYHSCKTIEELKSLKEKIQNHFGEVHATWMNLKSDLINGGGNMRVKKRKRELENLKKN